MDKYRKLIKESGYARAIETMRGLVPTVDTFAIMTAHNPYAKKVNASFNNEANKKLEADLKGYGYMPVIGHYGNKENSFFIQNINRRKAMELGNKHQQESVVWGQKTRTTKNNIVYTGSNIQLIGTLDSNWNVVIGERSVFVNAQNQEDYYTEIKSRKFNIPFFDSSMEGATFEPGSGIINKVDSATTEWFLPKLAHLLESTKTESNLGHGKNTYCGINILLRELNRYHEGKYNIEKNREWFGWNKVGRN